MITKLNENIQKIENYLNSMKSIEATFVQMASNGSTAEGRLFIKKPNKIRMEYAEPTNVLIVGNGENIIYNDLDLDQVTHIDYDDIPASMILSDKIKTRATGGRPYGGFRQFYQGGD